MYPALGIMQPTLGIFLNVLRNLKQYLDIMYGCLDFTVVVDQLINVLGIPLVWELLGVFVPF